MKWLVLFCLSVFMVVPSAHADHNFEHELEEARMRVDEAARVLAELYREQYSSRKTDRAMLGILLSEKPHKDGVDLYGVTPGGGAEAAGIKAGDLILEMDDLVLGETNNPMKALSKYMRGVTPGDKIKVVYLRDNERKEVDVTTRAHTAHMLNFVTRELDKMDMDFDLAGVFDMPQVREVLRQQSVIAPQEFLYVQGDLADYFDVEEGVVLRSAPEGSELKAGDVLLEVDGEPVKSANDARKMLGDLVDTAKVSVKRKGKERTVAVAEPEFAHLHTELATSKVIRIENPQGNGKNVVIKIETAEKPPEAPKAP